VDRLPLIQALLSDMKLSLFASFSGSALKRLMRTHPPDALEDATAVADVVRQEGHSKHLNPVEFRRPLSLSYRLLNLLQGLSRITPFAAVLQQEERQCDLPVRRQCSIAWNDEASREKPHDRISLPGTLLWLLRL
jgi:hypothetical protein